MFVRCGWNIDCSSSGKSSKLDLNIVHVDYLTGSRIDASDSKSLIEGIETIRTAVSLLHANLLLL